MINFQNDIPQSIIPIWKDLSKFVLNVCEGRDVSHGHKHMEKVTMNAIEILKEMNNIEINMWKIVIISAWLHDVADYKYDKDDSLKMIVHEYLEKLLPRDPDTIMLIEDIIDRISFSKELKSLENNEPLDWEEVLGEEGCIARDIVSDADKLEAIGKIGLERCIMYGREKHPDIDNDELIIKVEEHANSKLLRMKDEFFRTEPGKKLAEPLHQEFIDEMKNIEEIIKLI